MGGRHLPLRLAGCAGYQPPLLRGGGPSGLPPRWAPAGGENHRALTSCAGPRSCVPCFLICRLTCGSHCSCSVHPSVTTSKPQREIHNSRILKGKCTACPLAVTVLAVGERNAPRLRAPGAALRSAHSFILLAADFSSALRARHLPWDGHTCLTVLS